jgi:hypothetical protein
VTIALEQFPVSRSFLMDYLTSLAARLLTDITIQAVMVMVILRSF